MDPLLKVKEAHRRGMFDDDTYKLITERFDLAVSGITRIEKASGIQYPIAYVDPSAVIVRQGAESYQYGVFFARTIPVVTDSDVQVVIQISAPLIAYGLKGTIHAILAHEFLHYLELLHRIAHMGVLSDEITGNLFESAYADESRLFEAKNTPYWYDSAPCRTITAEGSTYAIGYCIPDAFSMRVIPDTARSNLSVISLYVSSSNMPLL